MASSAGFVFPSFPLAAVGSKARSAAGPGASTQRGKNHFIHGSQLAADGYSRKSGDGKTLSFHP